jgi:hypothetical protein
MFELALLTSKSAGTIGPGRLGAGTIVPETDQADK